MKGGRTYKKAWERNRRLRGAIGLSIRLVSLFHSIGRCVRVEEKQRQLLYVKCFVNCLKMRSNIKAVSIVYYNKICGFINFNYSFFVLYKTIIFQYYNSIPFIKKYVIFHQWKYIHWRNKILLLKILNSAGSKYIIIL